MALGRSVRLRTSGSPSFPREVVRSVEEVPGAGAAGLGTGSPALGTAPGGAAAARLAQSRKGMITDLLPGTRRRS